MLVKHDAINRLYLALTDLLPTESEGRDSQELVIPILHRSNNCRVGHPSTSMLNGVAIQFRDQGYNE